MMSDVARDGARLRIAVDIGGTFTDLVVFDQATGETVEAKVSTTPADFAAGVLDAITTSDLDATAVAFLVHGTTIVINAITQRQGVKTALVTTHGFRDALAIGRGNRPDMYNLRFHKPTPFVPRRRRFEVRERVGANGDVHTPLQVEDLETIAIACDREGVEAIAICFLHAYAHPEHEQRAAAFFRERLPSVAVSASCEITQEWREYERSSTVVLNAYVQPILDRYLRELERRLRERAVLGQLHVMLSNGGTATFASAREQPVQLVESGPAAGVIGAVLIGKQIGESNVISLDIGGTTAKCSLIEGGEIKISEDYRLEWTPLSPGYPVRVPVVDIVEIGAGGGSIAWFDDGGALRVGPVSSGADPGPAAYGKGGTEPTVTDAMLIAGVIDSSTFLDGRLELNPALARNAYQPIAKRLGVSVGEAAAGVIRLVNEMTVDALKLISVRRGYDPRDFSLVCFGGGGPMHASALAGELAVKQVIIPPMPGTFSAWGMLMTDPRIDLARTKVGTLAEQDPVTLDETFLAIEGEAADRFSGQGFAMGDVVHRRALDLRYRGQEHTVRVPVTSPLMPGEIATAFHRLHRQRYTFALEGTTIEIVNFRTISTVVQRRPRLDGRTNDGDGALTRTTAQIGRRHVDLGQGRTEVPVFQRDGLAGGSRIDGPLIVEEASATTLVLGHQVLHVDQYGNLLLRSHEHGSTNDG